MKSKFNKANNHLHSYETGLFGKNMPFQTFNFYEMNLIEKNLEIIEKGNINLMLINAK